MRIDPGVVRSQNADLDIIEVDRWEAFLQIALLQQFGANAIRSLRFVIASHSRGIAPVGEEQVALRFERNVRQLAVDRHRLFERAVKLEPIAAEGYVLRPAEKAADTARSFRSRRELISWIRFKHDDFAGFTGFRQMIRDARANQPAADD